MSTNMMKNEMEVIQDNTFSYEGFQVVRGEFFAHVHEPSFTFNNYKVSVNTACIKKLPDFDYVQILVNPKEKKLAVKPCNENEKDSFRWCSSTSKRTPKQITCRVFFAKVMELMGWNPNYRYKLIGKLIQSNNELLFVFDLNSPEIYQRTIKSDGKTKTSRTPAYPEDWKNQFGVLVEEHKATMQINTFDGYAIFGLKKEHIKQTTTNDINPLSISDKTNVIEIIAQNEESEVITNEQNFEQLAIGTNNVNRLTAEFYSHPPQNTSSFRQP